MWRSSETLLIRYKNSYLRYVSFSPGTAGVLSVGQKQSVLDENAELAQKLPPSLYVIYYQAIVYSSSYPDRLQVTLLGDKDEANEFLAKQSKQNFCRTDADSMDETEDPFAKHPLAVEFKIQSKDAELPAIKIHFHYLYLLQIVTGSLLWNI